MLQEISPGTLLEARYQVRKSLPDSISNQRYLAQDLARDNQLVVLSFPDSALLDLPGFVPAFQDAARRLSLVTQNGLLRVLDFGEHGGTPFAVLQYKTVYSQQHPPGDNISG